LVKICRNENERDPIKPVRVSPVFPTCLLILLSQAVYPAEPELPETAYVAEQSDRRLLVDAFDSDAWEALVRSRTALKDYLRAREALQIWRRNMAKKGFKIAKIDLLEAALEDAQGNGPAGVAARLRFLQNEPGNLQIWTELFSQAPRLAEAAEASEVAAKILAAKQFSGVWSVVVQAAIRHRDMQRAGTALELWRQGLLKLRANSPQLDHLQGDVDWAEGRQQEAVQSWNKSLSGDSKNVSLLEKLLAAHEAKGGVSEAMEVVTRLLKLEETASCYCRRATLYTLKGQWKEARADVLKAHAVEPDSDSTRGLYPIFEGFDAWYPNLKNLDERVRKARTLETKAGALLERSMFLVDLGLYPAAFENAAEAAKTNPSSLVATLWLGACANQTGRTTASTVVVGNAEALLKKGAAFRELDGLSLSGKVQGLLGLGQSEVARALIRTAAAQVEAGGEKASALLKELLESDLKMYESAHRETDVRLGKTLQRLLELGPERAELWLRLGKYQLDQGQLEDALESAAKAETNGAGEQAKLLIKAVDERRILP
jgi:tetratricopeptide (TPR) repeat protein